MARTIETGPKKGEKPLTKKEAMLCLDWVLETTDTTYIPKRSIENFWVPHEWIIKYMGGMQKVPPGIAQRMADEIEMQEEAV
jgi:hypothetical protein